MLPEQQQLVAGNITTVAVSQHTPLLQFLCTNGGGTKKIGQAEEEEKEGDDETSGFVDVTAPHPEFVLSPPNARVSSREFEDICEDLAPPNGKGELKNPQHPFLRALRRGGCWWSW